MIRFLKTTLINGLYNGTVPGEKEGGGEKKLRRFESGNDGKKNLVRRSKRKKRGHVTSSSFSALCPKVEDGGK